MKKMFVLAMTAMALSFAACGGSTDGNVCCEDSLVCACDSCATLDGDEDPADVMVATLSEQIEAGDVAQVNALLAQATSQVQKLYAAGDTVAAQAYASRILTLVTEKAVKLNELKVTATPLIDAVSEATGTDVNALAEEAKAALKADGERALQAGKEAGQQAVEETKEAARQAAAEAVDAAAQKATEKANEKIHSLLK